MAKPSTARGRNTLTSRRELRHRPRVPCQEQTSGYTKRTGKTKEKSQKIIIDCSKDKATFDTIFNAFGRNSYHKGDSPGLSLPTYIKGAYKKTKRRFVQGYAVASGYISDESRMPRKIDASRPYVIWVRPIEDNGMVKLLHGLVSSVTEAEIISQKPGVPQTDVAIRADDFLREIGGFGVAGWDELVKAGTKRNQELRRQRPRLMNSK